MPLHYLTTLWFSLAQVKVADFGLLKHHEGMGVAMTTKVQGTFGYIDPEYYKTNRVTTKSDVYG